jgi:hypothetical protein
MMCHLHGLLKSELDLTTITKGETEVVEAGRVKCRRHRNVPHAGRLGSFPSRQYPVQQNPSHRTVLQSAASARLFRSTSLLFLNHHRCKMATTLGTASSSNATFTTTYRTLLTKRLLSYVKFCVQIQKPT